jgi:tetratricopeptide (TPR) repeat protein
MTSNFRLVRMILRKLSIPFALIASLGSISLACSAQHAAKGTSEKGTSETNSLVTQARALVAQGKLAEAEIALNQARDLSPDRLDLLTLLGKVEGRVGDYSQAVLTFRHVAALQPKSPDSHLDLAIALADNKDLSSALDETAAALALAPHSAIAHLTCARILDDLHRPQDSEAEFALVSKLAPENADCLYYWSLLEREQGNLPKETELLQRLVKLRPNDERAWFSLGRSLSEQSRDQEAIPPLRKAIALDPDAGGALYLLAKKVQKQNPAEYRQLMQRFQQTRDKSKDLDAIKTIGNQAYQASQRQDWPESIRLFREALASCDTCSIASALHRDLGLVLCRDGQIDQGKAELQDALALDPDDRDAAQALTILNQPATTSPSSNLH